MLPSRQKILLTKPQIRATLQVPIVSLLQFNSVNRCLQQLNKLLCRTKAALSPREGLACQNNNQNRVRPELKRLGSVTLPKSLLKTETAEGRLCGQGVDCLLDLPSDLWGNLESLWLEWRQCTVRRLLAAVCRIIRSSRYFTQRASVGSPTMSTKRLGTTHRTRKRWIHTC